MHGMPRPPCAAAAGNMISIPVDDHVIIGRDRYISFKEEGWL
jgi:DNA repair protein RadC